MTMLYRERNDLRPGAFYWVAPVRCVDAKEAWENEMQPARFAGYREDGTQLWDCLGVEEPSDWPMAWIGSEITS